MTRTSHPTSSCEEFKHVGSVLQWTSLTYEVRDRKTKDKKQLISDLSGSVRGGQMLAVMGPSGAGKSTFLDLLAARKKLTLGSIMLDGQGDVKIGKEVTFVEQEDALIGTLTCRETLSYSARLSLPHGTSRAEIRERVDSTLVGLGLAHIGDNRIGTPIQRGISGGQKRRITIGNGLIGRPKILFLDEPTSGLDSATAYEVMSAIRQLATEHNLAVVATIHAPTWETFSLFNDILLLARGQCIYSGSVDGVRGYLDARGHPCSPHSNVADHMMSLVSSDFLDAGRRESNLEGGLSVGDVDAWARAWKEHGKTDEPGHIAVSPTLPHPSSKPNFAETLSKTYILTERNFLNYSRNLLAYGVRAGMFAGMGILLATVWVNLAQVDSRLNDRLSVHFFSVAFLSFISTSAIPSFLEERGVVIRERRNNLYSAGPYVLASTVVMLPFIFACTVLFSVICYWAIGLNTESAGHFFRFVGFLYLGLLAGETMTLLVAAIIPSFIPALALTAMLNGALMTWQGYFIRNLPAFWAKWAHWIDYQTYAFQLLVRNDLRGLVFPCIGEVANNTCQCSFPSSLIAQGQCAVSGQDVVDSLGFANFNTTLYAFILVFIFLIQRLAFWAVLALRK